MEMLFEHIIPVARNVRVVIGTQKVAAEHLPKRLLDALPIDRWTELPPMSEEAIHSWLQLQDDAERLKMEQEGSERDIVLREMAEAFHRISDGLPLHLIYSLEALIRSEDLITIAKVRALPACPTGDIRDYYHSLWERISPKAQAIVHVLAGLQFRLPSVAFPDCFGRSADSLRAMAEIDHLLVYGCLGIRPFHESLFAFTRDLSSHEVVFRAHADRVLSWLQSAAPTYWRWGWLWITKAQLDDPSDLLTGPNREWVVQSLVSGYPIDHVVTLLGWAERAAFSALDLPRFLELRALKSRAMNGPEFQTDEWRLFLAIPLVLSGDPHVWAVKRAELHRLPSYALPFVVRGVDDSVRPAVARTALRVLKSRLRRAHPIPHAERDASLRTVHSLMAVMAYTDSENTPRVIEYAQNFPDSAMLLRSYARESIIACNFGNVLAIRQHARNEHFDRDILAALCFEGISPETQPELQESSSSASECLRLLLGGSSSGGGRRPNLDVLFAEDARDDHTWSFRARAALSDAFFAALAEALSGRMPKGYHKVPIEFTNSWLARVIGSLERLALRISVKWRDSRQWLALRNLYAEFRCEPPDLSFPHNRRMFNAVRLALRNIAIDLCTLAVAIDRNANISAQDVEFVRDSPFWVDSSWLDAFSERPLRLHSPEAADVLVRRIRTRLDASITEFNERTGITAKLAQFLADHGHAEAAEREFTRAVECLLGYGWHKDTFAFELLDSLGELAGKGDGEAIQTLLGLAGEFEGLTGYTDGDETTHARKQYHETMVHLFPERMADCYEHLIEREEWQYAETVAITLVDNPLFESPMGQAVLETFISPSEVRKLEEAAQLSRAIPSAALPVVHRKIGRAPLQLEERDSRRPDASDIDETLLPLPDDPEAIPDPSECPPGNLRRFLAETSEHRRYGDQRSLVSTWLRYWQDRDCAVEALADLESEVSETRRYYGLGKAFDTAFAIALERQGRSKAYPWLVRAHRAGSDWQRMVASTDDQARARNRLVREHYRERWQEFLRETAIPLRASKEVDDVSIGLYRLVLFLMEIGEHDLARACAIRMSKTFQEELTDQPITSPEWSS